MFRCFFVVRKVEAALGEAAAAWRRPWTGQASNSWASVWRASSVIVAVVKLWLAVLVLFLAVIAFFASGFLRLLCLHVPCSCLVSHHLEGRRSFFETEANMLKKRISAGDKSDCGDGDEVDFSHTGETTVGSDLRYSKPCTAHLRKDLPADLHRVCSRKESGERGGSRQTPMEIVNAGEAAADGNADQLQAEQSWDEPKLDAALQAEQEALAAMYQELEQERNASATAAKEAMGMIARLQEEKAVALMEARQFQRMVEEKSMHDQEAIEALQKVVAKREQEKRELEEEMKLYRLRFLFRAQAEEEISRAAAITLRAVDTKQLGFTDRGNKRNNHIRGPILTEVSHEPGTPHAVEDSSLNLPLAKFMSLKRRSSSHSYAATESDVNEEDGGVLEEVSDRGALEKKRLLSVLECLWKLEEGLHQQAGLRQNALIGETKTVGVVSSCKTQSPVKRTMSLETATSSLQTMISAMGQHDGLWHSCYEDGNTNERTCDDASSSVEGDGNVTPVHQHSQADEGENKQEKQEAGTSYMISGEETTAGKSSDEEVLFEHDVYEVQESCYKLQGIAGDQNRWRHPPNVDRLGKPDHLFIHDEDVRDRNELEYARGDITMPLCEAWDSETNTWLEEFYWIAREGDASTGSKSRRCHSWTSLEEDVQQLKLRLMALEADRHLIKQTIDSLTRENGQMKLLQEIVEQLRDLRGIERNGLQQQGSFPYALSFQVL